MSATRTIASLVCLLATISNGNAQSPSGQSSPATTIEASFESSQFKIEGNLQLPDSIGSHPCIIMVHGDGPVDRTNYGSYQPVIQQFLRAGYACLSWDKPGSGASSGDFTPGRVFHERAQIVLDAIEFLNRQDCIDSSMIGLWGISQAGYVMPLVLEESDQVSFMIAVSCPAMNSIDQSAYFITRQLICNGYSRIEAARTGQAFARRALARDYNVYLEYAGFLDSNDYIASIGWGGIVPEDQFTAPDSMGEMFLDPASYIPSLQLPILAIFGEKDTQIDPFQSAVAFQTGLERARNPHFSVMIFRRANHGIYYSDSGCMGEMRGPRPDRPVGYVVEYLEAMEDWLKDLLHGKPPKD